MVAVPLEVPLMVTGVVDPKEQVISTPAGGAQVRLTIPVKPVPGTTVMVEVPVPPGALIVTAAPGNGESVDYGFGDGRRGGCRIVRVPGIDCQYGVSAQTERSG